MIVGYQASLLQQGGHRGLYTANNWVWCWVASGCRRSQSSICRQSSLRHWCKRRIYCSHNSPYFFGKYLASFESKCLNFKLKFILWYTYLQNHTTHRFLADISHQMISVLDSPYLIHTSSTNKKFCIFQPISGYFLLPILMIQRKDRTTGE